MSEPQENLEDQKMKIIAQIAELSIIRDARAERAQNTLIIISMQSLHEPPL